jgi:CheY-like chemotaxis protein
MEERDLRQRILHSEVENLHSVGILLVEDNPDHAELILKALQEHHALKEVHVATKGEEALDFLYQRGEHADAPRPGLILLDIKLPGMDGIEVLRQVKGDANLQSIPVVMLTTSAGDRELVESYSYGANSYIVKPVGFQQFVEVIKEVELYWTVISSLPR